MKPAGAIWPQRGMTLIELMVAMLLGLLLMAMVIQVYISGRQTQKLQAALASRQETVRFSTLMLRRDVERAGYRGCNSRDSALHDTLNPNTNYLYQFQNFVYGAEASAPGVSPPTWSPALNAVITGVVPATDVLTLRYAKDTNIYVRELMPDSSSSIKINLDADLSKIDNGDNIPLLIANCAASTVFQSTGFSPSSGTLTHNTGNEPPVGNATKDLGEAYTVGAKIMLMESVSYFLRESADGTGPALFRQVDDGAAEELVKGVESLQFQYGVDTDADDRPDNYVNADAVADWATVVAVRVALLAASLDGASAEADPRTFTLLDRVVGPFSDRRLRQVQTQTIGLRNALP